ncbi:MAG: hypothetical protein FOGNACKC_03300 [Anaerolineae bacterium]|nr:hypothetical protein [Anaerolineae bacterium]
MSQLVISLLGPPQLELNHQPIDLGRRKAVALLAYLAVTAQPHSRDALATLFWPELDQSRARAALRRTLSELNTALAGDWLAADRETVALAESPQVTLDVAQFWQLAADNQLAAAANLYRDDFLAGFTLPDCPEFDEWQFFQAESLRQELAALLDALTEQHTARQEYDPAIGSARRRLALDPLHEPAHRQLMRLYALAGQRSAALRQFQECQRLLDEELGVPPSPETAALAEQIRLGQVGEAPAPIPLPPTPEQLPSFLTASATPAPAPFVGRRAELAQLANRLNSAVAGHGQIVCVTGEAGSGKTALVRAFAAQAEAHAAGVVTIVGSCNAYTGLGDPYLPFREMLGQLCGDIEARLAEGAFSVENGRRLWQLLPHTLPAIAGRGPALVDSLLAANWLNQQAGRVGLALHFASPPAGEQRAQQDLFEQVVSVLQAVAQQQPLLLIIDDAQWADAASINLLFHLSRRLAASRVLLLVTYRPNDIILGRDGQRHPLEPVINEIRRSFGQIHIDLEQAMSRDFVEALIDTEPNRLSPAFREALFRQTQGHPLFTVELLRSLQERGDIRQDAQGCWVETADLNWELLPARIEAVIAERIGRVPGGPKEMLIAASVQGETFTAQVIAAVQHQDERQLLRELSLLEKRHHLVREQGEFRLNGKFLSGYRFTHTLFQQYLYNSLGAAERRLLHGDIAAALEIIYRDHLDEVTVQLAHHYARAGQVNKAIDYLLQAGDRARNLFAHQEAIDFYQQALAWLKQQGQTDRAARTLMKLGLTHHLIFNFKQARAAYDEGFKLWQQAAPPGAPLPPAPHPLRLSWNMPPTLNPTLTEDDTSSQLIAQLFSGLVALNPELDVVPEVAARWQVQDGGARYVFELRDDFVWSDGAPVTAADFVASWLAQLDHSHRSPFASSFFDIKGARAYFEGQTSNPADVAVRVVSPHTLEVELEGPTSYFLYLLTNTPALPIPAHAVKKFGAEWASPQNLVGNGPFILAGWEPDARIVLARNPRYPGHTTGNITQVELLINSSYNQKEVVQQYKTNQLDVLGLYLPQPELEQMRREYADEYFTGPILNVQYLGLNTRIPPFDDVRVRQALAMALDKEALAGAPLLGFHWPGSGGMIPPGVPGHAPNIALPYRPEQDRQLLAEAGYPGGRGFPAIEGFILTGLKSLYQQLDRQLAETLGIAVNWHELGWSDLLAQIPANPGHIFRMGWRADYPDPDNVLRASSHRAWTGWHHPQYQQLIEEARHVSDQARRIEMYQQADKLLISEAAVIPLLYGRRHVLVKPWVKRLPTSAVSRHFWKEVVIEAHSAAG